MEEESNQSPEEKQQDAEKEKVEEEGDLVWEHQCRINERDVLHESYDSDSILLFHKNQCPNKLNF